MLAAIDWTQRGWIVQADLLKLKSTGGMIDHHSHPHPHPHHHHPHHPHHHHHHPHHPHHPHHHHHHDPQMWVSESFPV